MGLPSVREVWRLALPAATVLLGKKDDLTRPVLWARRMSSHAPAFAALEEQEIALISIDTLRLLDERLTLPKVVRSLAKRNVSAVAVLGPVSAEAEAAADGVGLCLLALPADADLRDIEKDVIRLIVEREAQLDRRGRQVYRQLAQHSIEDRGLGAIADALRQIVQKSVVIQDAQMTIQALALADNSPLSAPEIDAALADRAPLHRWLLNQSLDGKAPPGTTFDLHGDAARYVTAVVIEGRLGGYLSILGTRNTLDDLDRLAAERGALVCAVEWAKQRALETAEQRLRGDFLDVMLTAGATEERLLARRASEMGFELEHQHVVVLFGMTGTDPQTASILAREYRAYLLNTGIQVFLCPYEGDLGALCSADPQHASSLKNLAKYAWETRERVFQMVPTGRVAVGIGMPGTGLAGLRRSFTQAQESLNLARELFDGDRVLSFGDLGLYHLLNRLQGCEELVRFYNQTLDPLARYDASHNAELVSTLEAFYIHHGNVSQTAESLHLHRNSLLYRLERIGQITELDLDDADDRFSLQLALKLQSLLSVSCGQTN